MEQTKKLEIIESVDKPGDNYVEVTPEIVSVINDLLSTHDKFMSNLKVATDRLKNADN